MSVSLANQRTTRGGAALEPFRALGRRLITLENGNDTTPALSILSGTRHYWLASFPLCLALAKTGVIKPTRSKQPAGRPAEGHIKSAASPKPQHTAKSSSSLSDCLLRPLLHHCFALPISLSVHDQFYPACVER